MSRMRFFALLLGLAACAAVSISLLSDWNDRLFLPLGLFLSAAANALNILAIRREKRETEGET